MKTDRDTVIRAHPDGATWINGTERRRGRRGLCDIREWSTSWRQLLPHWTFCVGFFFLFSLVVPLLLREVGPSFFRYLPLYLVPGMFIYYYYWKLFVRGLNKLFFLSSDCARARAELIVLMRKINFADDYSWVFSRTCDLIVTKMIFEIEAGPSSTD